MSSSRKKILFLLPYPTGTVPAQRLKFEQYFTLLQEKGYNIECNSFIDKDFYTILYKHGHLIEKSWRTLKAYLHRFALLKQVRNYDLVYLFQWGVPYGPVLFEYLLFKKNVPVLYDIDDPVFLPHASEANWFLKRFKNSDRVSYMISHASATVVTTDFLAEYAKMFSSSVTYIPTTIDTSRFCPKTDYGNEASVTIGWSGSHSTLVYLNALENVFKRLAAQYPHLRFKVVGDDSYTMPGVEIEAYRWSSEAEEELHRDIDIGVYPLPNLEWVQGKFGGKTLIYMAMGIPVVAQRTHNNAKVIIEGETGFLAESEDEWFNALSTLVEDAKLRKKMGKAGRLRVENDFSVRKNASRYFRLIEAVLEQ